MAKSVRIALARLAREGQAVFKTAFADEILCELGEEAMSNPVSDSQRDMMLPVVGRQRVDSFDALLEQAVRSQRDADWVLLTHLPLQSCPHCGACDKISLDILKGVFRQRCLGCLCLWSHAWEPKLLAARSCQQGLDQLDLERK